jgi:hypothetical protein
MLADAVLLRDFCNPFLVFCRGPSKTEVNGRGSTGRVTWIATSRMLQFIRQVIDGDVSPLTRSSKSEVDDGRHRTSGSSIASGARRYAPQPDRRFAGRGSRQGGSAAGGNDVVRESRRDKENNRVGSSRAVNRYRTGDSQGAISNQEGKWRSADQKGDKVSRDRNGAAWSAGPSNGRAVDGGRSARWTGSSPQQPAALQNKRSDTRTNESSPGSWGRKSAKDAFETRGGSTGRQRPLGNREPMRGSRGGWGERKSGGDTIESGTLGSKKHKLRRPSVTYGKARRW